MNQPAIHRRIFVVGTARSGTTLVQCLLAAHSQATSFPESHFFSRHFSKPFRRLGFNLWHLLRRDPGPRLRAFLDEAGVDKTVAARFDAEMSRLIPADFLLPLRTRPVATGFLRCLDQLALARGKTVWIEKTPMHLYTIPLIERLSKNPTQTHFVHVIRGGVEVVSSLHKASQEWEKAYDLDTCVARWNRDLGFSLRRTNAPNDHFVHYEDIASRPEATLKRLCSELGLAWEPDMLDLYAQGVCSLVTSDESWKANTARSISPSARFENELTAEQRARVEPALRQDLYRRLCAATGRGST